MESYELDAVIETLESLGGSGTWHISLYIRPDKSVSSVRQSMIREVSEAESIKSDKTRSRVQSSLEKIVDVLGNYRKTPENGLVVFASPNDVYVLDDLPFPCPENRYHCGKEFQLDGLQVSNGTTYGLIVVERGCAVVGLYRDGSVIDFVEMESQVMGKTKAGGQSAARYSRERERQEHEFYEKVRKTAQSVITPETTIFVIGGTLTSAEKFAQKYTDHDWSILGTYPVDHADEQGLKELAERASDAIQSEDDREVRECVERFLRGVRDGSAAYGRDEVTRAIEMGAVEHLLLSSNLSVGEIRSLSAQCEEFGGDTHVVPITFQNATMFENLSGGYGALLRFPIR